MKIVAARAGFNSPYRETGGRASGRGPEPQQMGAAASGRHPNQIKALRAESLAFGSRDG